MKPLNVAAFAKVNLSLVVLGRRADGYHELDTVFQAIDLHDELLVEPAAAFSLACDSPEIPGGEENLVTKAARLLERRSGKPVRARVTLRKRIPHGGGLAGGSSDAAAALRGLDAFAGLALPEEALRDCAEELGSDVPFFLTGGRARGTGRGEKIAPLPDAPPAALLLLIPPFSLSTPEVFRALSAPALTDSPAATKLPGSDREAYPDRNDLEPAAESLRTELATLKRRLAAAGARSARLSGSGSTVFGLFGNPEEAGEAARRLGPFADGTRALVARTLTRGEYAERSAPRVGE